MQTQWIDQVRQLLAKASDHRRDAFHNLDALKSSIDAALDAARAAPKVAVAAGSGGVPYPIRRRHLLAQIGLKSRYYGLADEVQAFVYAAGAAVLQELDNDQLEALHGWLLRWIDCMDTACDSELSPPAR